MKHEDFLKELYELCLKHGVVEFTGCGCCDSPFVSFGKDENIGTLQIDTKEKSIKFQVNRKDHNLNAYAAEQLRASKS